MLYLTIKFEVPSFTVPKACLGPKIKKVFYVTPISGILSSQD